jgi:hypothetical protein
VISWSVGNSWDGTITSKSNLMIRLISLEAKWVGRSSDRVVSFDYYLCETFVSNILQHFSFF